MDDLSKTFLSALALIRVPGEEVRVVAEECHVGNVGFALDKHVGNGN